ncbi:Bombyrin [Operophtera brumata]|uniref:Bombyrin n=1 Tax=Operophtera brumata TaxID=104452 RepID=A0A0L7KXV1_OPEBR|nr:Bombyrin [Operophtera brumata]
MVSEVKKMDDLRYNMVLTSTIKPLRITSDLSALTTAWTRWKQRFLIFVEANEIEKETERQLIQNIGSCSLKCNFENGTTANICFVIVIAQCQTILGWKLCEKLQIVKRIFALSEETNHENQRSYQGLWYEIQKFPNAAEKGGKCGTAEYKLEGDVVKVKNSHVIEGTKAIAVDNFLKEHAKELDASKFVATDFSEEACKFSSTTVITEPNSPKKQ